MDIWRAILHNKAFITHTGSPERDKKEHAEIKSESFISNEAHRSSTGYRLACSQHNNHKHSAFNHAQSA